MQVRTRRLIFLGLSGGLVAALLRHLGSLGSLAWAIAPSFALAIAPCSLHSGAKHRSSGNGMTGVAFGGARGLGCSSSKPGRRRESAIPMWIKGPQFIPACDSTYEITVQSKEGNYAARDSNVTVHAIGVVKETGAQFWNTREQGGPFTCTVGKGNCINGWDRGMMYMQEGETRKLNVPAREAYGDRGYPELKIPPGADLEFTIECLVVMNPPEDKPNSFGRNAGVIHHRTVDRRILREVRIRSGDSIDFVEFVYDEGEPLVTGGGNGTEQEPFRLEKGETLYEIRGGQGELLDGIQFITNFGRKSAVYGGRGGGQYVVRAGDGKMIVGLDRNDGSAGKILAVQECIKGKGFEQGLAEKTAGDMSGA